MDRHVEVLDPIHGSISLYGSLVSENPASYTVGLTHSLGTLEVCLSELNRHIESYTPELVRILGITVTAIIFNDNPRLAELGIVLQPPPIAHPSPKIPTSDATKVPITLNSDLLDRTLGIDTVIRVIHEGKTGTKLRQN